MHVAEELWPLRWTYVFITVAYIKTAYNIVSEEKMCKTKRSE